MFINIKDLPVPVKIGFFPEERQETQEILVSIRVEVPDEISASDDINLTVDYCAMGKCIYSCFENSEIKLIETTVQLVGQTILKRFPLARSVDVEVVKTKIPDERLKLARVSVSGNFKRKF